MGREYGSDAGTIRELAEAYLRPALLVLLVAALAAASAFLVSSLQTKMYEATAHVVYGAKVDYANLDVQAYTTPAVLQAQLQSVPGAIALQQASGYVERAVSRLAPNHAPYSLSVDLIINPTSNSWAEVAGRSADPKTAMAAASAGASSFIAYRRVKELQQVQDELKNAQLQMRTFPPDTRTSDAYLSVFKIAKDLRARQDYIENGGSSFRIAQWGSLPTKAYSPRPVTTAFLAFIVVFVLGVGVLFLLDLRNVRLRDNRAVRRLLRLPVVGEVVRSSDGQGALAGYSFGTTRESLSVTVDNLEFMLADRDVKSLAIAGSEASDAAGVLACDLAVAMAGSGKRVGLIDGALQRGLVFRRFGLPGDPGVTNVVVHGTPLSDALHAVGMKRVGETDSGSASRAAPPLSILCGGGPRSSEPSLIVGSRRFATLIQEFAEERDLVIVASPPLVDREGAVAVASAVDGLVCVVDLSQSRRRTLDAAQDLIVTVDCDVLGAVILSEERRHRPTGGSTTALVDEASGERSQSGAGAPGSTSGSPGPRGGDEAQDLAFAGVSPADEGGRGAEAAARSDESQG